MNGQGAHENSSMDSESEGSELSILRQRVENLENALNIVIKDSSSPNESLETLQSVEFYAALANGWVNTRLEHDKSLLSLSAGGIQGNRMKETLDFH